MSRSALRSRLEAEFLQSGLPPGTPLPSARELARRWGADFSQVSRSINELVAAGHLVRLSRRRVQTGPRRVALAPIGVLDTIPGVVDEARELAQLFGAPCRAIPGSDITRIDAEILAALDAGVGGFFLWPGGMVGSVLQQVLARRIPVVMGDAPRPGTSCVRGHNREIGRMAAAHLLELGHRRLVFVTPDPKSQSIRQERWEGVLEACREAGLPRKSATLWVVEREDLARRWPEARTQWAKTTGWVTATGEHALLLSEALARAGTLPGRDISLISCQDHPGCSRARVPITAVTVGDREVARLATVVLIKHMRSLAATGHMGECLEVLVQPHLRPRASSASPPGVRPVPPSSPATVSSAPASPWSQLGEEKRRHLVSALLARPHPWLSAHPQVTFSPVPLRRLVNQCRERHHQWLGDLPLLHLPGGRHTFHGIDYEVLPPQARGDVVVLRNPRLHSGKKKLPDSLTLSLPGPCRALAFLWGAGFIQRAEVLGRVVFHPAQGRPERHDIRAAGPTSSPEAEVQDWWPTAARIENERTLPVPITADGDPLAYERYLYSWLWPLRRRWPQGGTLEITFLARSPAALALVALTRIDEQPS